MEMSDPKVNEVKKVSTCIDAGQARSYLGGVAETFLTRERALADLRERMSSLPEHLRAVQPEPGAPKASDTQIGGTHYRDKKIQPWHAMEAWMSPEQFAGFLRGNAIKYLARCDDKGGIADIKKARHYLDKLIDFLE